MNKRHNFLLLLLTAACVAAFLGYRAMDALNTDTVPPEIRLEDMVPELSVSDPKSALFQGITVRDHRDGDVTDSLVVEHISLLSGEGDLMVSYAAFDHSGNVAKAQREAKYTDYQSPKFTLRAPLRYPYSSSFDVLSTVGATDVIDGDIQHRVRATSMDENSIATMGTHDVQFQVTNSLGDTVTQVFPVEVYDPEQYDATLQLKKYLEYLPVGATFDPSAYPDTFILRGETTNLRDGLPRDYKLKTEGTVDTQTPGTYPVEFRVTYTLRHETNPELDQSFVGCTKLIVIVEG